MVSGPYWMRRIMTPPAARRYLHGRAMASRITACATVSIGRSGMPSLVLELQQEALSKDTSVTDLLRKALVVARKLEIADFETWINAELNGFVEGVKVPAYLARPVMTRERIV